MSTQGSRFRVHMVMMDHHLILKLIWLDLHYDYLVYISGIHFAL